MTRKFWLIGAIAMASAVIVPATISSPVLAVSSTRTTAAFPEVPAGKQVSLTLGSYMPLFGAAGINELNSLVTGFESLHHNIHVTIENETSSGAIDAQIQQDEVAGHTPDVVQDTFNDLKFVTKQLGAVNLDQVVGKANVAANFTGKYKYAPAITHLGEINGSVYGVPWTLSTPVLFYNADLFVKAGLNPQNPPKTWAELESDALRINKATGAAGLANGCVGAAAAGADWCLQAILDSDGGGVMNAKQTKLTFDSKQNAAALTDMQQIANAGAMVNLSSAQAVQAFASQKLAFVLNSSAVTASLVAADGGHFTLYDTRMPSFGTAPAVPTNSGSALFMLSKQKLNREADWELIQYLSSAGSETTITESIGYPPLRPSIATQPQYLQAWANSNSFLTPNLFQLEHITPWLAYPGPNFASIATIIANAATGIIFQSQAPAQTLAAAQSQATALL